MVPAEKAEHQAPPGTDTEGRWPGPSGPVEYTAHAHWLVLRRKEKPAAEMFSVSYLAGGDRPERPVTFLFNGGPGASSAFLHLGAVGPRRVAFPTDGSLPPMPPRLVDNEASWLAFSDLVFVDPVGTGFSRIVEPQDGNRRGGEKGGDGNGAVLISPALEFAGLFGTDYDIGGWVDRVPTMAAAAFHHGRSRAAPGRSARTRRRTAGLDAVLAEAADFASGDYARFLARGAAMPEGSSTLPFPAPPTTSATAWRSTRISGPSSPTAATTWSPPSTPATGSGT
jgi:hypothetical protein